MAAGDISKGLIQEIRDPSGIDDAGRKKIPSDILLYRKLSYYQDYIMVKFKTKKTISTVNLITNTSTYEIPYGIFWIRNITFSDGVYTSYSVNDETRDTDKTITLEYSENFVTGTDKMYINGFIRPVKRPAVGLLAPVDEDISSTVDPIIDRAYHQLLVKAVLSEFRRFNNELMPLERVEILVKELRDNTGLIDGISETPNITRISF